MPRLVISGLPPRLSRGAVLSWLGPMAGGRKEELEGLGVERGRATMELGEALAGRLLSALDGGEFEGRRLRAEVVLEGGAEELEAPLLPRLAALLEREAKAQRAALEEQGARIGRLRLLAEEVGVGGLLIWQLALEGGGPPLADLKVGSPVSVVAASARRGARSCHAVIVGAAKRGLRLALREAPDDEDEDGLYELAHRADEVSTRRQRAALGRASLARGDRLAELRATLLGEAEPRFEEAPMTALDAGLDPSQRAAVSFALGARDLGFIHGPPGTGKTRSVVELMRQAVARGERVLCCAPSHTAVDNLVERLAAADVSVLRLGHPARVSEALLEHSLEARLGRHEEQRRARKLTREAHSRFRAASKPGMRRDERRAARDEGRALLDEARGLEDLASAQLLDEAAVIAVTLTGVDSRRLGQRRFDLCVIDEACQAVEPSCWIPLARCERVVLAGDPCQLPPTVIDDGAARAGLAVSLPERLLELHGEGVSRLLTRQYRMHTSIMELSSERFYEGRLEADPTVASHRLCELEGVSESDWTSSVLRFIDTAGAGWDEEQEEGGLSRFNSGEVGLVEKLLKEVFAAGLKPSQVGVITPYSAQVRQLRARLGEHEGLEVGSVDGFQGREKELIIVSLVRANQAGAIGFLTDLRRMNVAITRARRGLVMIGDSATLGGHPFYSELFEELELREAFASIWEFPELS